MADDNLMDQDEIERLLNQAKTEATSGEPRKPADDDAPAQPVGQEEIESLLDEASVSGGRGKPPQAPEAQPETTPAPAPAPPAQPQPTAPSPAADDEKLLAQADIEKLLSQAGTATAKGEPPAVAKQEASPGPLAGEGDIPQGDVDYLLSQAEQALESIGSAAEGDLPPGVSTFRLEEFFGAPASTENATLDLICDVQLDLKIELGRTHMYLEDVLKLRKGSVVPLDKLAGDPVDVYVNGRLIARGEVLVLNDNFCVRVAELIAGSNVFA